MEKENSIKNMVVETMEGLYKHGSIDEITICEVRALTLEDIKPYPPRAVMRLRRKLKLSQVALARFINTSMQTVQSWEQGIKKPSGTALN